MHICPHLPRMESTAEPSPVSAPTCPWCPGGASGGPRSPPLSPSTLGGCAGPALCSELIQDPTLSHAVLPLDHWPLLSCAWTSGSSCPDHLLSSLQARLQHPFLHLPKYQALSSGSSGASCIFLLPAFVPYFLPDCGSCARVWTPTGSLRPRKARPGSPWFLFETVLGTLDATPKVPRHTRLTQGEIHDFLIISALGYLCDKQTFDISTCIFFD